MKTKDNVNEQNGNSASKVKDRAKQVKETPNAAQYKISEQRNGDIAVHSWVGLFLLVLKKSEFLIFI